MYVGFSKNIRLCDFGDFLGLSERNYNLQLQKKSPCSLSGTLGGLELTLVKVGFLGDHSSPGSEVAMLGALLLLLT